MTRRVRALRAARDEAGFTLVETMAALVVFTLVTLGIVPLLLTSMKGAALSRSFSVGKNAALKSMERLRGLPYFVSYGAQSKRVDVLDLYYPATTSSFAGQSYSGGIFTTVCNSTTTANPACPKGMAPGYELVYAARFVNPTAPGATESVESMPVTAPSGSYRWNATDGSDSPPTQMLDVTITSRWVQSGRDRTFSLRSLVGDRKFGGIRVRGLARVDYGIQVRALYVDEDGARTQLTATGGTAESRIESRTISTADESVRAAEVRLTEITGAETGADIGALDGAVSAHHAPPDSAPAGASAAGGTLTHPELDPVLDVAGIDETLTSGLNVGVANELPTGTGSFVFKTGTGKVGMWVDNQADTTPESPLQLFTDATRKIVSVRAQGTKTLKGSTSAATGALAAADRRVETGASVEFTDLRMLPARFVPAGSLGQKSVVVVNDFAAQVSCKSVGSTSSTTAASWSASFTYWAEQDPGNDLPEGAYVSVALDQGNAAATLASLQASNPLVYEGVTRDQDLYLFDDPAAGKTGYLASISSSPGTVGEDSLGQVTSAGIEGALSITTAPTNPLIADSAVAVSMGKLSCSAVDKR